MCYNNNNNMDKKILYNQIQFTAQIDKTKSNDEKSVYTDVVFNAERVNQNGWVAQLENIDIPDKNSKGIQVPLFFNHDDGAIPIGGAYDIQLATRDIDGEQVKAFVGSFEISRTSERGKEIDDSIQNGYTKGVSVGIASEEMDVEEVRDDEGNYMHSVVVITKGRLYELSVTPLPADSATLIKAMIDEKQKEKMDQIKKDVETAQEEVIDMVQGLSKEQKREIARTVSKSVYKAFLNRL